MKEEWTQVGSLIASLMFLYAICERYLPRLPPIFRLRIRKYANKFTSRVNPFIKITFGEFVRESLERNEAYSFISTYLSEMCSRNANRFVVEVLRGSRASFALSLADNVEIIDEFQGVELWWEATTTQTNRSTYPFSDVERLLTLTFHECHRDLILGSYLKHVLDEGKQMKFKSRQLKLYTNSTNRPWWSSVVFEHPASFDTLAMEPKKKEQIINDLQKFKNGKDSYAKIGKAWKRGYLLYGPPGTGKSTMIVVMANFMHYDIYDLELTAVKNNTELRQLLIHTSSKSIIVIEDIDCSLDLTGQRKEKKKEDDDDKKGKDPVCKNVEDKESKVTLSGLLNVIDGIWSACVGERIIIFTTNFIDKLDPALIRRGRMDKHIKLSYCCYEAFKILAKNYLEIESHDLYTEIEKLLGEVNMTPADVAENLMLKSDDEDKETCLKNLISALEKEKEEAKKKAAEEANRKAEEEEEGRLKGKREKEKEQSAEIM